MKLEGIVNIGRNRGTLVIRRTNVPNGRIVFHFEAVDTLDDFYKICPEPLPREVILPGGERKFHVEEPAYKKRVEEHINHRINYLILKSLVKTEPGGLVWETVDWNDPDTWGNWESEMTEFGLNFAEIQRIKNRAMEVNSLNDRAFDEALEDFLAGRPDRGLVSYNEAGPDSTVSSESVNDSASDLQDSLIAGSE